MQYLSKQCKRRSFFFLSAIKTPSRSTAKFIIPTLKCLEFRKTTVWSVWASKMLNKCWKTDFKRIFAFFFLDNQDSISKVHSSLFFFFFEFVKFGLTYDQLQCRLSGKSLVIRGDRLSSQNNLWWTSTGFPLFVCSSFWQVKGTFGPFFLQLKSSSRKKERCLLRKSAYISSFPQAEIFGTPLQSARF